ncbi:MAG: YceI family protein [Gammaproteobacteria bacterium]|nr:YceI family protein [Gammaproteobacteria bacterium]
MRKLILVGMLASLPVVASAAPEFFTLDPTHTYPHFAISHLGFSTMDGRFDQTSGKVMIDRENKTGSVEVKIAAVSVSTGFQKRDDHLRSADFLNVTEFPDITYKSTKVALKDKEATVEGTLTMMGVSKPVTLKVSAINCGENPMSKKHTCGFRAEGKIKRSDFGIKYGLPAVGDDMELWFEAEGLRD